MHCVAFITNTTEPRPIILLLQQYNLSMTNNFIVQRGDMLNISWYGDVLQQDQIHFSLAYYNNGIPPGIPNVSVEMNSSRSNCNAYAHAAYTYIHVKL